MNRKSLQLIGVSILLNVLLIVYLVYNHETNPIHPFNEKGFKDSINYLNKQNLKLHSYNDSLYHIYDSVRILKQTVIDHYHEKITFLDGASTDNLDQYIRANY